MQQQTIIVVLSPMLSLRGLQYHILHQCKKKVWKIQKNMKKMQVLTEQEISDFMYIEKHAAANHHLTYVSPERARISRV